MAEAANPVIQRNQLASALREARVNAGMSINDVAEHLICSAAKVSRMETGRRPVSPRDVRDLCNLFKLSEDERDRLMALARDSRSRAWWETRNLTPVYSTYVGLEVSAASIQDFKSSIVPGLLQTKDYAHAVTEGFFATPDPVAVNRLTQTRMERQEILFGRPEPPHVHVVLDEAALCRVVGGYEVMTEQLEKLISDAASPNIEIQIVPFSAGAHAGVETTFTILSFADSAIPTAGFSEDVFGALQLDAEQLIRSQQIFGQVVKAALPPEESVALIARYVSRLDDAADQVIATED
jgi:transcriptional regulator with XRE-family HTH domain